MTNTRVAPTRRRGFTLLELVVAIVVLAILSALAIPTFSDLINRSKDAVAEANLSNYADTVVAYSVSQNPGAQFDFSYFTATAGELGSTPTAILSATASTTAYTVVDDSVGVSAPAASTSAAMISVAIAPDRKTAGMAVLLSNGDCAVAKFGFSGTVHTWSDAPGSYTCAGQIGLSADPGSPGTLPHITTPAAPVGLAAHPQSGAAQLTWTPTAMATSYLVLANGIVAATVTSPSATVTGLSAALPYSFAVEAANVVGTSAPSATVSAQPIPLTPSGLTGGGFPASVTVTWNPSTGATGYRLYQDGSLILTQAGTGATVGSLTDGLAYAWTVSAYNASGESPVSASYSVGPVPPAAPTLSSVTNVTSAGADLAWTASTGATRYSVWANGTFVAIQTAGLTYTDTSQPAAGTPVSYTVRASDGLGSSADSNALGAITTPAGLTGSFSGTTASLNWTGSAAVTWHVSASGTLLSSGVTTGGSGTARTATVTGLAAGTTYSLTVAGSATVAGATVTSPASNAVTGTTLPLPPADLSVQPYDPSMRDAAQLSWTAVAGATGYHVYQDGTLVDTVLASSFGATVAPTETTLLAVDGTTYTFTVSSYSASGEGAQSAGVSITTTAPVAPIITSVTWANSGDQETVYWDGCPSCDGYSLYANGTLVSTSTYPNGMAGQYTDTTQAPGVSVTYTMTYYDTDQTIASDVSALSSGVTVTTPSAPGAPTGVTAVRVAGSATSLQLNWATPASNGGAAIRSYKITASTGATHTSTVVPPATLTTYTWAGLTNATSYTFTIQAGNNVGLGAASSASTTIRPDATLTAPTGVTASRVSGSSTSLTVAWTVPTTPTGASAPTSYTMTSTPSGHVCATVTNGCTVTGLTAGTGYTFTLSATNANGTSPASASSASVAPAAAPTTMAAPTSAALTTSSLTVNWVAPSNNGSAITSYTATASPGGQTCTINALTCTISGLTHGTTYTFTVRATNAVGTSAASPAGGSRAP